jgi:diaminopimelate decarboxylase
MLPRPKRGDVLAVLVTGAYNYSMASHYNRLPKPAIVLVSKQGERVAVKRETFEDLCRNDI